MSELNGVSDAYPAIDVRHHGRVFRVPVGTTLTVGRSPDCTIVLPQQDRFLSRRACSLHPVAEGYVLIRNDSRGQPLVMRPPAGEGQAVPPLGATTSLPHRRFSIVFMGGYSTEEVVNVDAEQILQVAGVPAEPSSGGDTLRAPEGVTAAQRRVLTALAAPLLTCSGARARPASYADIGRRLGLKPGYVRNVVKDIRESLASHGVPGLLGDVVDERRGEDFRPALARWAVWSGLVDADAVATLPPDRRPGQP